MLHPSIVQIADVLRLFSKFRQENYFDASATPSPEEAARFLAWLKKKSSATAESGEFQLDVREREAFMEHVEQALVEIAKLEGAAEIPPPAGQAGDGEAG